MHRVIKTARKPVAQGFAGDLHGVLGRCYFCKWLILTPFAGGQPLDSLVRAHNTRDEAMILAYRGLRLECRWL